MYNGRLESGIELVFFEELSNVDLLNIHMILKDSFKDYSCYYLNNSKFEGCIKEYLFNDGCGVPGVWKDGAKQLKQTVKPIVKKIKKSNIKKPIKKLSALRESMIKASKNKDWARKLLAV